MSLLALSIISTLQELSTGPENGKGVAFFFPFPTYNPCATHPRCARLSNASISTPSGPDTFLDRQLTAYAVDAAYRYHTRHADSEGLAVGALAAPWAFAGMLLSSLRYRTDSGDSLSSLRVMSQGNLWTHA